MNSNWHTLSTEKALQQLGSRSTGLTDAEVQQQQNIHGKNELTAKKKVSALVIFFRQFLDVMILVLAVAAVISIFIGEVSDTIVIIVIVILNAVIGFVQEYRAEKAIEALKKLAQPNAHVIRNGSATAIKAAELVPGDIILIEAGNTVPADIRLLQSASLKINEASLTGESNAIDKSITVLAEIDSPLGDRTNMAFMGTQVINGHAKGLVVATGMNTEIGHIAGMLNSSESTTPLQHRLTQFSRRLTVIIILLCIALFFIGYMRGEPFNRMLLTSISLAVAAIPEALPAVVTISLALGARRLAKRNVLIRKLYAVETLGSVTFICTDKTGTLTKNEMMVQDVWTHDEEKKQELMIAMSLNHEVTEKDGKRAGDPTEIAMVEFAKEQDHFERVEEIPFDSDRKAMTTIHDKDQKYWVITKGAAEVITGIDSDEARKLKIQEQEEKMAKDGMRVIGFTGKELYELPENINPENIEKDMHFIGLVGLIDPPREEAKKAIRECKDAGIVPVMITGDHPLTANSIAKKLGIIDNESQILLTGKQLAAMDPELFKQQVEKVSVYARVSPEQKLSIVEALQQRNQFVAMTGDGVNDAPALKKANIGIAMGITGTDVTKEAAHMILLDDNFATIVNAVKTGRRIYDNIRKFIKYILTGNAAEIWAIFLAPIVGLPIPLLPVHILWINLVTDGLPALALASEPAEKDIMKRPPRLPDESIFAKGLGVHILWVGLFIGLTTLASQWFAIHYLQTHWQTIVFTVLCFSQLWHVLAIRSETRSLFSMGMLGNKPMLAAIVFTVLLQLLVIYHPFLNQFFHTQPLTFSELSIATGISSLALVVVEIEKTIKRTKKKLSR